MSNNFVTAKILITEKKGKNYISINLLGKKFLTA